MYLALCMHYATIVAVLTARGRARAAWKLTLCGESELVKVRLQVFDVCSIELSSRNGVAENLAGARSPAGALSNGCRRVRGQMAQALDTGSVRYLTSI